jgi:hypothetical protein
VIVAYRQRNGHDGKDQTVVARSTDGERYTTLCAFDGTRFGARWMERPALVRVGPDHWRMWVCMGSPIDDPDSKRWWIELLEAADPAAFAEAPVLPGFPGDELNAVKDRTSSLWTGVTTRGSAATSSTSRVRRTA